MLCREENNNSLRANYSDMQTHMYTQTDRQADTHTHTHTHTHALACRRRVGPWYEE